MTVLLHFVFLISHSADYEPHSKDLPFKNLHQQYWIAQPMKNGTTLSEGDDEFQ